jgi:hypothetical protein
MWSIYRPRLEIAIGGNSVAFCVTQDYSALAQDGPVQLVVEVADGNIVIATMSPSTPNCLVLAPDCPVVLPPLPPETSQWATSRWCTGQFAVWHRTVRWATSAPRVHRLTSQLWISSLFCLRFLLLLCLRIFLSVCWSSLSLLGLLLRCCIHRSATWTLKHFIRSIGLRWQGNLPPFPLYLVYSICMSLIIRVMVFE